MSRELSPCPSSPNCVSSQADPADKQHFIEPFSVVGRENPIGDLAKLVRTFPRTSIVVEEENYLHVTFTSWFFRFVDDVEFLLDAAGEKMEVRSASRVGYGDMGVNRKRVEKIRALWVRDEEVYR